MYANLDAATKKRSRTRWGKITNEALISEVNAPEDVRKPYSRLGYGEKLSYWESIAVALRSRPESMFPGDSYPSAKVCNTQFDLLLQNHRDSHQNHQFKSGSTEDIGELASGLEEIMEEIDMVADDIAAEEEIKVGIAAEAIQQENMMKKGRVTPKSNKKTEPIDVEFPAVKICESLSFSY
jgi:hypothetical protein